MTRARVVLATVIAGLTVFMVCGVLAGWRRDADVVLWAMAAAAYVWFIVVDSDLRGRSGVGWLLVCLLFLPLGLPVFLFLAVRDRVQGRHGIEIYWAPGVRWCYLVAVGLAAVALALAAVELKVTGPELRGTGTQAGFIVPASGSCDASAVGVLLGKRPALVGNAATSSPADQAELRGFADRCVAHAGRRVVASTLSLTGAFALALVGAVNGRRRRPVPPPAAVTVAA